MFGRRNAARLVLLGFAALVVFSAGSAYAAVPAGWTTRQLTSGSEGGCAPKISGSRLVWSAKDGVYTWVVSATAPTHLEGFGASNAVVSGNRIAWDSHGYIRTTIAGQAAKTVGHGYIPTLSGNRIAWRDDDQGGFSQVVTWKVGDAQPTTLTADPHSHFSLTQDGDLLAWSAISSVTGKYTIFTWKPGDGAPVAISGDNSDSVAPQVSGDNVVFETWDDPSAYMPNTVWLWNATTGQTTRVSRSSVDADEATVLGSRVVWHEGLDVMTWAFGDAAPTQVTSGETTTTSWPQLSGDRLVWYSSDGVHEQIVTKKLGDSQPSTISVDADNHGWDPKDPDHPTVQGDEILWVVDNIGGASQVMMSGPKTVVADPSTVGTKLKLSGSSSVKHKHSYKVSGSITPSALTGIVRVYFQRWVSRHWKSYSTVSAKISRGKYSAKYAPRATGTWRVYASFAGKQADTIIYRSSSASKGFKVK
jgi:hypothetical protein